MAQKLILRRNHIWKHRGGASGQDTKTECMSLSGLGFTQLAMKMQKRRKRLLEKRLNWLQAQSIFEARWDVALGLGKTYRNLGLTSEAETQLKRRGFACRKGTHIFITGYVQNIQFGLAARMLFGIDRSLRFHRAGPILL